MGIRPSTVVVGGQPHDEWTDMDFRILEAYQIMQDEACGHCGNPIWLCRNEEVMWAVKSDMCYADRALEEWHDKQRDSKGKSGVKAGVHPYATAYVQKFDDSGEMFEDTENLPSRQSFFEGLTTV